MTWVPRGRDFWSSADGRFDLLHVPAGGYWLAIDHDGPVGQFRHPDRCEVELWCELRTYPTTPAATTAAPRRDDP